MRLMVTGGLGFIGMNFINYWLERYDDEIVNVDKGTYASNDPHFLNNSNGRNYSFLKGDISDAEFVNKAVKDVDVIVNFAAESHVDNSISDSSTFVRTNIMGTHTVLEAVRKSEARFHHISTDEVFGSLDLNSKIQFTENSCYSPKNPYSATKASADHLVNAYINTYGIKATISNCSNNYGPLQHPEKLIPKTIYRLLQGKKAQLYGNGNQIRDWIFVEDHCSGIDAILKKGLIGESYLIGAENERTNFEVVSDIARVLDKDPEQSIEFIGDRPGHDVRYAINPNKIRSKLDWKPKHSFDEGLKSTVRFYVQNRHSFDRTGVVT